jgi:Domain of unknown function (DUF4139)/N-terminal domain of unknown function (DUF4140)
MIPIDCESRIERVAVYARGAVVTRAVSVPEPLPEGAVDLRVRGVTAFAETGSLRVLVDGDGGHRVTALRARLAVPEATARPGHLREEVRTIALNGRRLSAEQALLQSRRTAIGERAFSMRLPRGLKLDPAARFADVLALRALLGEELERIDARLQALTDALAENERRRIAAELALRQGSSAEARGDDRMCLDVEVRLGAAPGDARGLRSFALEYVVAAARWWPAYTARFSAQASRVNLALDAFVAQSSGEDWSGVAIAVSTADLVLDARLPELASLRIGRAQLPPRRGYRAAPAGLEAMFEGYDRALEQLGNRHAPRSEERAADLTRAGERASRSTPAPGFAPPPPFPGGGFPGAPPAFGPPPMPEAAFAPGAPLSAMAPPGFAPAPYGMPPPQHAAFGGAPPPPAAMVFGAVPRAAMAAPPPMRARMKSASLGARLSRSTASEDALEQAEAGFFEEAQVAEQEAPIEPGEAWLDFDALVLADPADHARRGRLQRDRRGEQRESAMQARAAIEALAAPAEALDPVSTRGRFDHRYDAIGTADVPANGRPHRVAIDVAEAPAKARFITVPREAAEVYREAQIQSPFAAPLLSGPVEVFLDGALITTAKLHFVDRKGVISLGLGVEDRLRVARNARVQEGSAGLLGGLTTVEHAITIDLASSLGQSVTVDVLERLPVSDDKDIEVKVVAARPEPEKYTQVERGAPIREGLRFEIEVPKGEKQRVELTYRVTLPSKNELVGGNRRE